MNILIFDTETTGFVDFKKPCDDPCQPRIVQIAAVLVEVPNWTPRAVLSLLVKPDGFTIPPQAEAVHGITTCIATQCGVSCSYALHVFMKLYDLSHEQWAFIADYDRAVIQGELTRLDRLAECERLNTAQDCMKPLTDICKLPSKYPGKYKWPKLEEAYRHFIGTDMPYAHDALMDVQGTIKVLRAWKEGVK